MKRIFTACLFFLGFAILQAQPTVGQNLLPSLNIDALPLPAPVFDSSYLNGFEVGLGELDSLINLFGGVGQDSVLDFGDLILDSLNSNYDSLAAAAGYLDSLDGTPPVYPTVVNKEGLIGEYSSSVTEAFNSSPGGTATDPFTLLGLFKGLFAGPRVELGYGIQNSQHKFYDLQWQAENAQVVRVGSYLKAAQSAQKFVIEPSWHFQLSWVGDKPENFSGYDPVEGKESKRTLQGIVYDKGDSFNPILLSGDIAMTGRLKAGSGFEWLCTVGSAFGTHAPHYRQYAPPYTLSNVGFTTGFGGEFGTGVMWNTGSVVFYTTATATSGQTLTKAGGKVDEFREFKLETGINFAKAHIRYSVGKASWQAPAGFSIDSHVTETTRGSKWQQLTVLIPIS